MPWNPSDAPRFTKRATTQRRQRQWADIANATLDKSQDEGKAVRTANGVIRRSKTAKGASGKVKSWAGK